MSALLILALTLGGMFVGYRYGHNILADGIGSASKFLFFTLLAALAVIYGLRFILGAQAAGATLLQTEQMLDRLQAIRQAVLGVWDWRLAAAIVVLAIGGFIVAMIDRARAIAADRYVSPETIALHLKVTGRAPTPPPRAPNPFGLPLSVARVVRNCVGVLSILAALTITTVVADAPLRDLEVRFAETQANIRSAAVQARAAIEQELIVVTILEAEDAAQEACAQTGSACARYEDFLAARPEEAVIARDPELRRLWFGAETAPPLPMLEPDRVRVLLAPLAPSLERHTSESVAAVVANASTEANTARAQRAVYAETIDSTLIGIASSAGQDAFMGAVEEAGASGEMLEVLAAPMFSDVLQESISAAMEETLRAALGGSTIADAAAAHLRPVLRALFRSPQGSAVVRDAGMRAAAVLSRTRARSQGLVAELLAREQRARDEEAAAQARAAEWERQRAQLAQNGSRGSNRESGLPSGGLRLPEMQRGPIWTPPPVYRPPTPPRPPIFRGR